MNALPKLAALSYGSCVLIPAIGASYPAQPPRLIFNLYPLLLSLSILNKNKKFWDLFGIITHWLFQRFLKFSTFSLENEINSFRRLTAPERKSCRVRTYIFWPNWSIRSLGGPKTHKIHKYSLGQIWR